MLKNIRILNNINDINIVIQGKGNQNIISDYYSGVLPSEIYINGAKDSSCNNKICYLKDDISNITLRFKEPILSLRELFRGLSNIIEADLSYFDSSLLNNMIRIFYDCSNIKNIKFGNINTSKVTNMRSLFKGCSSLTSLDLSKFDTSNNTSLYQMFCNCANLK